jgi:hypothetical protein
VAFPTGDTVERYAVSDLSFKPRYEWQTKNRRIAVSLTILCVFGAHARETFAFDRGEQLATNHCSSSHNALGARVRSEVCINILSLHLKKIRRPIGNWTGPRDCRTEIKAGSRWCGDGRLILLLWARLPCSGGLLSAPSRTCVLRPFTSVSRTRHNES